MQVDFGSFQADWPLVRAKFFTAPRVRLESLTYIGAAENNCRLVSRLPVDFRKRLCVRGCGTGLPEEDSLSWILVGVSRQLEREMRGCQKFLGFSELSFECISMHNPPHFHAEYSGNKTVFDFRGNMTKGDLGSKTAIKLVREWVDLHATELEEDWNLAQRNQQLIKIEPLK
jgi:hypothetical protein